MTASSLARWYLAEFKANKHKAHEIIDTDMDWDINDFGLGLCDYTKSTVVYTDSTRNAFARRLK